MGHRLRTVESMVDAVNKDFWCDRPVLVTGATGLVGNWLVKRLASADTSRFTSQLPTSPVAPVTRTGRSHQKSLFTASTILSTVRSRCPMPILTRVYHAVCPCTARTPHVYMRQ